MGFRARPAILRFLLAFLAASLAAGCLTAAYTIHTFSGPTLLLRQWPGYALEMAAHDPEGEVRWLRQLLRLSPRDTDARVRLALLAEWRGDLASAREGLTQATALDRRYRAQWSRLEFAARHPDTGHPDTGRPGTGDPGLRESWDTARRCFAMSYGDRRALLETVWRLRPDGQFLLQKVIPDSAPVLFYTTAFLMEQGDLASARSSFARLTGLPPASLGRANAGLVATAAERANLGLDLTDLHLDRGDPASALAIWRSLTVHQLLRVDGAAEAGRGVMNSRFRTAPIGRGFDWRPSHSAAFEMRRVDEGWRVDLGAHPPDRVALLQQRVLLPAGPLPRIEVMASAPAFLRPRLLDEATGQELAGPLPRARVAKLSIEYGRPAGQPPWRAPLVIHEVRWNSH